MGAVPAVQQEEQLGEGQGGAGHGYGGMAWIYLAAAARREERKGKTLGGEAGLLIGARRGSAGCLGGHVCSSSILL